VVGTAGGFGYIGRVRTHPTDRACEVPAMSVIKLVIFLLLLLVLVYLFATNTGQTVDLRFFGREYLAVDLFWVVVASFVLGVLVTGCGLLLREWRHRRELGRLRRHGNRLEQELADLRTLPLQELTERHPTKDG
jgi:uncharacterized integral membrane protein